MAGPDFFIEIQIVRPAKKSASSGCLTSPPPAPKPRGLIVTAQPITFEPGLFSIEISAPSSEMTQFGIMLPCIRIEFFPTTPACPGRGALLNVKEGGWLWASDVPAFITVAGGIAGALMTTYCENNGMAPPSARISTVPSPPPPAPDVGLDQIDIPIEPVALSPVALLMVAHVTGKGDVAASADGWLGCPGHAIEGFSLTPLAPLGAAYIEYQAILGHNWTTPWVKAGEFCGSRGLQLPIFGFRARVANNHPEYGCIYAGRFAGGATSGPCRDGEACQVADAPLECFSIFVARRPSSTIAG